MQTTRFFLNCKWTVKYSRVCFFGLSVLNIQWLFCYCCWCCCCWLRATSINCVHLLYLKMLNYETAHSTWICIRLTQENIRPNPKCEFSVHPEMLQFVIVREIKIKFFFQNKNKNGEQNSLVRNLSVDC